MTQPNVDVLSRTALFAGLAAEDLEALAGRASPRRAAAGGVIFRRGDPAATLYVIREGEVEITVDDEMRRDKDVVLAVLGPGDAFGELALFDDSPRSATATATMDCQLLALGRSDFVGVLDASPTAARRMLGVLAGVIRRTNERLAVIALLDVNGRLAKAFLDLMDRHGVPGEQGIVIDRPDVVVELAGLSGLHPRTVEKRLREYQYEAIVRSDAGRLVVPRPELFQEWLRLHSPDGGA